MTGVRRLRAALLTIATGALLSSCAGASAAPAGYAGQEAFDELEARVSDLEDAVGGGDGAAASGGSHADPAPADAALAAAPHWDYSEADNWGEVAPEFATCDSGSEQSPIDLTQPVIDDVAAPEVSHHASAATVTDNGHTVQVNVAEGGTMTVSGHEYPLAQFHFHAPSEHTVNGEHLPLEIHFVHKDAEGSLAVLGVLVAEGAHNAAFDELIANVPATGEEAPLSGFDVSTVLPAKHSAYEYPGSLTTPPCTEGVAWNVLATPIEWSADQIEALSSHFPEENNRPVQDANDRDVLFAIAG